MFEGSFVGMGGHTRSWAIGSLVNFLRLVKLRSVMYGKHGVGGGACSIVVLWGKWGVVALGGGIPTNNEPVNDALSKDDGRGACLQCRCEGVGRGSTPPKIRGRPCN